MAVYYTLFNISNTDHRLGPLFMSKIKTYFLYEAILYFLSKFVCLKS